MSKLLTKIIDAHGGLDRWDGFTTVDATIVTDGALWGMKGLVQDQDPRRITVWLHDERSSLKPFGDPNWHSDFVPNHVAIEHADGTLGFAKDRRDCGCGGHGFLRRSL